MTATSIIILLAILGLILVGGVFVVVSGANPLAPSKSTAQSNLRTLVMAQRAAREEGPNKSVGNKAAIERQNLALAAAAEGMGQRKSSGGVGRVTLEKKLKYAKWPLTTVQFRSIQMFFTIAVFIPAYAHATISLQLLALLLCPLMVGGVLERSVNKRFEAFDKDYPVMLLSYVSLLKTGLSAVQGLEAAGRGLEPDSMVRAEIELLVERLRLGLTEEQAIGAFGEDVAHPEIELFVQSLILSKRVGGTLSLTLERLAKQVRKRQQFRKQANAVVGLERASSSAIGFIMTGLLVYMAIASPDLILGAFTNQVGVKIFQGGLSVIIMGFYWMRRVTHIKI